MATTTFLSRFFDRTQCADCRDSFGGKSFNTRGAALYEFGGEQLVYERLYMDF